MSTPFFLTRQTANLMEDLARALAETGSLFLLYGEPGVGKTRLLRELRDSRLEASRVHWIDMRGVSDGQIVPVDRSGRIEEVFASAVSGDVIVVDHFEIALKKSRHQLFVSWAEAGQAKELNLVIACASEGFNELRQLSQQYQIRIQSFELMPLENDEVDALLGFHLFPDHPISRLDIPSPLRRRLAASRGVIARVLEIADEDGSHIRIAPAASGASLRRGTRIIVAMLLLVALVAGIGWYLMNRPAPMLSAPTTEPETAVETAVQHETPIAETEARVAEAGPVSPEFETETPGSGSEVDVTRASPDAISDSVTTEKTADEPTTRAPDTIGSTASTGGDREVTDAGQDAVDNLPEMPIPVAPGADTGDETIDADEAGTLEPETGTVSDSEAVLVDREVAAAGTTPEHESRAGDSAASEDRNTRFQRKVKRSLDWLVAHEDETGTVQILLLSHDSFDPRAYFGYIDELVVRGIDEEQVHIFKTLTGGRIVYSVFYGEYTTRQQAYQSIPQLPAALRELDPIARSVGGIRTEIRRLENQN